MSSLPLSKKMNEENLFKQLNLPLSAKWPEIKKAYGNQVNAIQKALDTTKDIVQKKEQEQKLTQLNTAYQSFSQRLSQENSNIHQTKEALKTVGLNETADWDKVNKRFDELRKNQPEQASILQPQLEVLKKNKSYLELNLNLGKYSLLGAALILGAAGVSWAAYNQLNQEEKGELLEAIEKEDTEALENAGITSPSTAIVDDNALEQYVMDNSTLEDEMLSLLGLLPSPQLTLTLQYKLQVFSSLVKTV